MLLPSNWILILLHASRSVVTCLRFEVERLVREWRLMNSMFLPVYFFKFPQLCREYLLLNRLILDLKTLNIVRALILRIIIHLTHTFKCLAQFTHSSRHIHTGLLVLSFFYFHQVEALSLPLSSLLF